MRHAHAGLLALLGLSLLVAPLSAQEGSVERDPFSAPSVAEIVDAADQDRVSRITTRIVEEQMAAIEERAVREAERRIIALLEQRLTEMSARTEELVDTRLSEMSAVITGLRDQIPAHVSVAISEELQRTGQAGEAAAAVTDGATFIACVDGRPLYRDESGSTFYLNETMGDTGVSRCGN